MKNRILLLAIAFGLTANCCDAQDLRAQYDEIMSKWRDAAITASIAASDFYLASRDEADAIEERWLEAIKTGKAQMEKLKPIAMQLFDSQKDPDSELYKVVTRFLESELQAGSIDEAFAISEKLMAVTPKNPDTLQRVLKSRAKLLVSTNRFTEARELLAKYPDVVSLLDEKEQTTSLWYGLEILEEMWQKELEIRRKEKEADDLPRVEVKTTKGTFVIELFENEAPDTVGNFIFIIEQCRPLGIDPDKADDASGYDNMAFHRVINSFMAQTGGFNKEGGLARFGWKIYDELGDNARNHFRGSVSMAKTTEPDSGESQFFINFIPTPGLNSKHTCFGRVISGMETVDRLNRTHSVDDEGKESPLQDIVRDHIISVRVLRKRDHEYKPNMVE